jgi:hypothetical protein
VYKGTAVGKVRRVLAQNGGMAINKKKKKKKEMEENLKNKKK